MDHPQVRGAPQGLGLFLPAADTSDMLFIAKHSSLPYLPRATRSLLQQVLCPPKQGQPLHVMIPSQKCIKSYRMITN